MRKRTRNILIGLAVLIVVAIGLYFVPPIHDRLAWRLDNLRARIYYFFNPPEEVVFVQTAEVQQPTPTSNLPTLTPTFTPITTELVTPTITPTPLPQSVILANVPFINQTNRWNYCGPANLAMALKYWGWQGEPGNTRDVRDQIAAVVKPGENNPNKDLIQRGESDVNVMPYEMANYVNDNTEYKALYRFGGDINLLKTLIAAGFPVITEKGIYERSARTNKISWMGHYALTTGYDDTQQTFIWQDSYVTDAHPVGKDQIISYADYITGWRSFDYVFLVVYPPDREAELMQLLGSWADWNWAARHALEISEQEIPTLTDDALFFAWFNKGTSYAALADYGQAAAAYDYAYVNLYPNLPNEDLRPYRIMWYQTGPYKAYYWTSDYEKVIQLADANIATTTTPIGLEETLDHRALAEAQLGLYDSAYADMRQAVYYNSKFQLALDKLAEWGLSP